MAAFFIFLPLKGGGFLGTPHREKTELYGGEISSGKAGKDPPKKCLENLSMRVDGSFILLTSWYGEFSHNWMSRKGRKEGRKWIPINGDRINFTYLGVSKNRGTPKWMVYNGTPYFLMDDLGKKTLFLETPISHKHGDTF